MTGTFGGQPLLCFVWRPSSMSLHFASLVAISWDGKRSWPCRWDTFVDLHRGHSPFPYFMSGRPIPSHSRGRFCCWRLDCNHSGHVELGGRQFCGTPHGKGLWPRCRSTKICNEHGHDRCHPQEIATATPKCNDIDESRHTKQSNGWPPKVPIHRFQRYERMNLGDCSGTSSFIRCRAKGRQKSCTATSALASCRTLRIGYQTGSDSNGQTMADISVTKHSRPTAFLAKTEGRGAVQGRWPWWPCICHSAFH